jgi:hypothetical protein
MTLADFDINVKPHLHFIEAGAAMAARHASLLPCKPDFATIAEHELAEARGVLARALADIAQAQQIYAGKQLERNIHA